MYVDGVHTISPRLRMLALTAGLVALSACAARRPDMQPDQQLAQQTLTTFFEDLHAGRYELAAQSYGGTYQIMIDHNPELDPTDHAGLFRNACTINGAQCLPLRSATLLEPAGPQEFRYEVEFQLADGSIFELGPCCGESEQDSPARSTFIYSVVKGQDGQFRVMDTPVYLP